MIDNSPTRHPMPTRDAKERCRDFDEVTLGYDEETAVAEARRCLSCRNPSCVRGCPVGIDIPGFLKKVSERKFDEAYSIIALSSSLPAVCGRVCPQERQCEGNCIKSRIPILKEDKPCGHMEPVAIGRLERFVADFHRLQGKEEKKRIVPNGIKVAVVGSGPSGLACAGDLAQKGYDVTVFEALHVAGGVLMYGIPEFRLPKKIVEYEIEGLKKLGVKIVTDVVIGQTLSIDELMQEEGFKACFIGTGAGLPRFMGIPGEDSNGVYSANEFLTRINLMKAYLPESETPIFHPRKVAVVGGGNVAMDACRAARRLGADVYCVYRRGREELPARKEEIEHAEEEGVGFRFLTNPIAILSDRGEDRQSNPDFGRVIGIRCQRMCLGKPDSSGRRRPEPVPESEFTLDVDCVIMALGTTPNPLIRSTTPGIETDARGCFVIDERTNETTKPHVYAGGDVVTGAATVILAMGAGKKAAKAIDEYFNNK